MGVCDHTLGDLFPFAEGKGDATTGALGAVTMEVLRPKKEGYLYLTSGLAFDGQWYGGGGLIGGALGAVPPGWNLLENEGDGCTIALEAWFGGRLLVGTPEADPVSWDNRQELFGLFETSGSNDLLAGLTLKDPPPVTGTHVVDGPGVGAGTGADTFSNMPPFSGDAPVVFVMVLTRSGTDVLTQLYVDGVAVQDPGAFTFPATGINYLQFGVAANLLLVRAGIWRSAFTPDDVAKFTFEDAGQCPSVLGDDSLIGIAGDALIHPGWSNSRTGPGVVIATERSFREARRVHQEQKRRYSLPLIQATSGEVDRVRRVLANSRGGAGLVRWRHSQDDPPGPAASAPWWRILNASEAALQLDRVKGGARVDCTIELEEA